jgi:hypothetical protein
VIRTITLIALAVIALTIIMRVGVELGVALSYGHMPAAAWLGLAMVSLSMILISTSAALLLTSPTAPPRETKTVSMRPRRLFARRSP